MTPDPIQELATELQDAARREEFSGVVLLDHRGRQVLEFAAGMADRAEARSMTIDTRLATASGTKGFTALTAVSLIEDGLFDFDTCLAALVGDDLPHVAPWVTVEHLLSHTSGVGDYLDEDEIASMDEYVLDMPVHSLQGPEDYLPILNRYRQVSEPGARFAYNNSGFVMLALAIERASGHPYHDEVRRRVFEPASMANTDFLRSDHLPAGVALGYLTDGRTNVLHLPVIGTGDGGAYTTGQDMMRFWNALFAGQIVNRSLVERMVAPNRAFTEQTSPDGAYGLGFWIANRGTTVQLEGADAGVSLRSGANRNLGVNYCLIANNADDVWPLARIISRHLSELLDS